MVLPELSVDLVAEGKKLVEKVLLVERPALIWEDEET